MSTTTLAHSPRAVAIVLVLIAFATMTATAIAQNSAGAPANTGNAADTTNAANTNGVSSNAADAEAAATDSASTSASTSAQNMQRLRLTLQDIVEERLAPAPQLAFFILGVGLIALGYGWRVYRVLVVVMGFLVGALSGALIAFYTKGIIAESANYGLIMALIGGTIAAFLAIPYIRFALFMLAGLAGGYVCLIAGQSLAPDENSQYAVYFGLAGFLVCGLVSLAFFELVVVIGTSVLGACCIITSGLALAFNYQPGLYKLVLHENPWTLPVAALALSIVGLLLQMQLMPKGHLKTEKAKFAAKSEARHAERERERDDDTRESKQRKRD